MPGRCIRLLLQLLLCWNLQLHASPPALALQQDGRRSGGSSSLWHRRGMKDSSPDKRQRVLAGGSNGQHPSVIHDTSKYPPLQAPDFMIIGQQKCGTSSLWKFLTMHPKVTAPLQKELMHWARRDEECGNNMFKYLGKLNRGGMVRPWQPGMLLGEFSATYLSCACCPATLKTLNPSLKVVAIIRSPIDRALSRFREASSRDPRVQSSVPGYRPNSTFAEAAEEEIAKVKRCMRIVNAEMDAKHLTGPSDPAHFTPRQGLLAHMRAQCAATSQFFGFSLYDVLLTQWLRVFPPEQMHVILTEDLESDPESVMSRLEDFLGLPHHTYNASQLHSRYNPAGCYQWSCNSANVAGSLAEAARRGELVSSKAKQVVEGAKEVHVMEAAKLDEVKKELGEEGYGEAVGFFRASVSQLAAWAGEGVMLRKGPLPAEYTKLLLPSSPSSSTTTSSLSAAGAAAGGETAEAKRSQ